MARLCSVLGTRPQIVKAASVTAQIPGNVEEVIIHTGQHYDPKLSDDQIRESGLRAPDINLKIGSGPHGAQTGQMLRSLEEVFLDRIPALVLVYGDCNSTLAAALAAVKLHIPVAHVEAGVRSYNRAMPEEINRVMTDAISEHLMAPTPTGVEALRNEGITDNVTHPGDVMYDSLLAWQNDPKARQWPKEIVDLREKPFVITTLHRPENVDTPAALRASLDGLYQAPHPVVLPLHPRTRASLERHGLLDEVRQHENIRLIEPISRHAILTLAESAWRVCTDSGGLQKEAFMLGVPCITMRRQTEWVESLDGGWNLLTGNDPQKLAQAWEQAPTTSHPDVGAIYGHGRAAQTIARLLADIAG